MINIAQVPPVALTWHMVIMTYWIRVKKKSVWIFCQLSNASMRSLNMIFCHKWQPVNEE